MSKALCCDRCGDFYTPGQRACMERGNYVGGIVFVSQAHMTIGPVYDLCDKCLGDIYEFMNIKKERME